MTNYQFSDGRCRQLFMAAYPVKHMKGFAWKESPKTLDNHWKRETSGKTTAEKDELLKVCLLAGEAQTKYRIAQEKAGERLFRPKGIAVWFNAGGYYDDIGSHADLTEKVESKICCIDGCQYPALGSRFIHCEHHYQFTKQGRLRDRLTLVPEIRKYYANHPEIRGLTGRSALDMIIRKARRIGK